MALINCRECGKEISDSAASCPHCGCPVAQVNIQTNTQRLEAYNNYGNQKKKHSTLSVWALVLSLFGCTAIVAFVLALVDLCINDKTKKHLGSWFALIFTGIYLFVFFVLPSNDNNSDNLVNNSSPAPVHNSASVDDGLIDTSTNDCSLKYLKHEFVENAVGDKCLAVFYEFTNNSDEAKSFDYTFSDKAFQNGIELSHSFFIIDDLEDNGSKDIKPGITVEVYSLFQTQDNSVVELEVSPWVSFNDKPLDTMELSLE